MNEQQPRGALRYLTATQLRAWRTLLTSTNTVSRSLSTQLTEDAGISLFDYEILVRLTEAPNRSIRMAALADATGITRSRLTHTVKRLETKGLVSRATCGEDGRGVVCSITKEGIEFLRRATPGHLGAVREKFAELYTDEELDTIASLLGRIETE